MEAATVRLWFAGIKEMAENQGFVCLVEGTVEKVEEMFAATCVNKSSVSAVSQNVRIGKIDA